MKTEELLEIIEIVGLDRDKLMDLLESLKGIPDGSAWKELNAQIDTSFRVAAEKTYPKCIIPFDAEVDIVEDMSGAFVSAYVWVSRYDE